MKKIETIIFLLLLSLVSFGMINQAGDTGLKFSHKLHSQDVGAECSTCHSGADSSATPLDNLLPDMPSCFQCHEENTECTYCHENQETARVYPRITDYITHFPHKIHITNNQVCTDCHVGVDNSENISDSHLPAMLSCIKCHDDLEKPDYCFTCHSPQDDRRPTDHKMNWTAAHGLSSYTNKENCRVCHTDNYCLECHRGDNLDRQVHPFNFVNNHSIAAKSGNDKCYICHEEQAFCQECHRAELVLPKNHSFAGWSNKTNGGTHSIAAKFDLDGCMSCHNDINGDPVCAECHTGKIDD